MKFCQFCGRPLQDDEVCNCQAQRQTAPDDGRTVAAAPAYQQPAAPQPQSQPQRPAAPQQSAYGAYQQPAAPQQPYYAAQPAPAQKASDNKFVKAIKSIPDAYKTYWTDRRTLIGKAKSEKDIVLPLLLIAILFFVNLILGICYFARMCDSTFNYHRGLGMFSGTFAATSPFKFGFVLLGALIITVFTSCLYISFRFFSALILSKKNPAQAFTDALIEFGIHAVPVTLWLFLGALLSLATSWLTVPFVGMAMAYYVVIGVANTLKECTAFKNPFLRDLVIAAFVMLAVGLTTWMFFLICQMNIGGGTSGNIYM